MISSIALTVFILSTSAQFIKLISIIGPNNGRFSTIQEKLNNVYQAAKAFQPNDVIRFLKTRFGLVLLGIPVLLYFIWFLWQEYLDFKEEQFSGGAFEWSDIGGILSQLLWMIIGVLMFGVFIFSYWQKTMNRLLALSLNEFVLTFLKSAFFIVLSMTAIFLFAYLFSDDFNQYQEGNYPVWLYLIIVIIILSCLPAVVHFIPFSAGLIAIIVWQLFLVGATVLSIVGSLLYGVVKVQKGWVQYLVFVLMVFSGIGYFYLK